MKKIFRIITFLWLMTLGMVSMSQEAVSQDYLPAKERDVMVGDITDSWNDWDRISISGKVRITGVSVNPSVKIYMEKDSVIRISLRVPLMGEVGRAEIEGDTILVVNKMKKTYVKDSLEGVMARYPMTIGDVQALLLGRITLPGLGMLSSETAELVDIYPLGADQYGVMPIRGLELEEYTYGYLVNSEMQMAGLTVMPAAKPESHINLTYTYDEKEYDIIMTYYSPEAIYGGAFLLDYPERGGNPIEPIKITGKYNRLTFENFLKSF